MDYSELIRTGLKEKKVSITKAANWLNISRQSFYNRLETGNFFMGEINILMSKGILRSQKMFTTEQVGDYLLKQKNLDDAIMNLDDM